MKTSTDVRTVNKFMYKDSRKQKFHKNGVPKVIKDDLRKPEFPEDWTKLKNIDPLVRAHADFDWVGLEKLLGEAEELDQPSIEKLGQVLHGIIAWVVSSRSEAVSL